jgi:hypothetical protein
VKDIGFLRGLPKLERISFAEESKNGRRPSRTAEEFWKEYDAQAWLRALRYSGASFSELNPGADGTLQLNQAASSITDLTLLRGAAISSLNVGETAAYDLSPLADMPLRELRLFRSKVIDLGPLAGMPLRSLHLSGTGVTDLSPLRGMPLSWLKLDGCAALTDLSPLGDCKALTNLTLPPNAKELDFLRRGFPRLERLGFKDDAKRNYRPDRTAAEFWAEFDERARIVGVLEGAGFAIKGLTRYADGTWEANLTGSKAGDVNVLRTLPLSGVQLGNTDLRDLEPLRGMPLRKLYIYNCPVTDLSPLAGMSLDRLAISGTKVSDISVVRGMPLDFVRLHDCRELTDLSPLEDCGATLANVTLPPKPKDVGFLRGFPKLTHIGYKDDPKNGYKPDRTAAEFWREYDAKRR